MSRRCLLLPPSDSHLRELFDVRDFATPEALRQIPPMRRAISAAHDFFAAEPAAKSINCIYFTAQAEMVLVQIGRRGGRKKLWSFGYPLG